MSRPVTVADLKALIRDIPDFPKPGILFRDITTLLNNGDAFQAAIDGLAKNFAGKGITKVVGIESRGFLTAAPLAYLLHAGFVPVRKKGKLPFKTNAVTYDLEYGTDTLEIHEDAVVKGEKVLIVDDLLATGGTAKATCDLVRSSGGRIAGVAFLIELAALEGRSRLSGFDVFSLITYP